MGKEWDVPTVVDEDGLMDFKAHTVVGMGCEGEEEIQK